MRFIKGIIFDPEISLSFEGDSGPYLQYTRARCVSILSKAAEVNLMPKDEKPKDWSILDLERYLYRFPIVVQRSSELYGPHIIANYLIELARIFNSWYGNTKLIDSDNPSTHYHLALVEATSIILERGLYLLGIESPEKM